MDLPATNKIHQDINEGFGENAKLLEQSLKTVDWKFFVRLYCAVIGLLLVTTFAFIVIVRFALWLI